MVKKLWLNESGAVATEYVLVAAFIGLSALVIFELFPPAIVAYLKRIYTVVVLPFP